VLINEKQKNEHIYHQLMLGTVSHELLTPLNAIINLSGMFKRKFEKENNKEDIELISVIHYSSLIMHLMIQNMLDLMKLNRGNLKPNVTSFNPISMSADVLELLELQAKSKNLEIKFDKFSFDLPKTIYSDSQRFK
jgi:signal transduction histidine kinase